MTKSAQRRLYITPQGIIHLDLPKDMKKGTRLLMSVSTEQKPCRYKSFYYIGNKCWDKESDDDTLKLKTLVFKDGNAKGYLSFEKGKLTYIVARLMAVTTRKPNPLLDNTRLSV